MSHVDSIRSAIPKRGESTISRKRAPKVIEEALAGLDALVAENRQLRETLVTVALPLEVLRGQIVSKAYTELSPELQSVIVSAVDTIRVALAPTELDHHD